MTSYKYQMAGVAAAVSLLLGSGCSNLPGNDEQQGAAIGGLSGAAIGAAVGGSEHRLLGALLGGALGAGGGYVIGANADRITGRDRDSATRADQRAKSNPVSATEARNATSADINNDGFVTMDEVVALEKAGLSDREIVDRMRASGQVFELTNEQKDYLRSQGLSQTVINQLPELNAEARDRLMPTDSVIGRPADRQMGGSSGSDF